jgi:hypothetical protein
MTDAMPADNVLQVNEWLDVAQVNTIHWRYQKAICETLETWQLADDFKAMLAVVDLDKKAFTPDLACRFFTALIHQETTFNTSGCAWFVDVGQPVAMHAINPMDSVADAYFLQVDELFARGAQISVPRHHSAAVAHTAAHIRQALAVLAPIDATYVNSKLLQSISIFAGNAEAPTSCVLGAAPGRIYIREVTDAYPEFYYLDMMIHEISHLYFNVIAMFHPLISDYSKHFFSVAKNTERPIFGIYNATFVLYRLIQLYPQIESLLRRSEQALSAGTRYEDYLYSRFFHIPFHYDFRLELYRMKCHTACTQLLTSGALTPLGQVFLEAMQAMV